ncbi:MAG: PTS system fructose-specific EIIABC component [Syntrophorhabdus sp. PtaU1.Bin002]|nr:MAG: PTS system fructose-specific EIIABC component [Syntrophorhabdus sp. PtaB.Bin006]OPY72095.1 MAG: PTS system fructose-specific EIIABC component [Syntrophorhabdus sp. PtaU1.Bin002]
MRIEEALQESCVIDDLKGKTKGDVLVELVGTLKNTGLIENEREVVNVILEREKLGSTGIGDGVAIPHGKLKGLRKIICVFGRSIDGIDFDAIDSKPVRIFFLLLAPENSASLHLKMLSRISKLLRDPSFRKRLLEPGDAHDIYRSVVEEDRKI